MNFRLRTLAPLFAVAALTFSGCSKSDTHELVLDDTAAQLDKMAATLATVTDKASAEKATKDLQAIAVDLKKVAIRAQALGQPSADVMAQVDSKMKTIEAKFAEKMDANEKKLKGATPEVTKAFTDSAEQFIPAMKAVADAFTAADKK